MCGGITSTSNTSSSSSPMSTATFTPSPSRTRTFDIVHSQAVFEHVADPFSAAEELLRVTKPGGIVLTEVAFLQPLHAVPYHFFNMTLWGVGSSSRTVRSSCQTGSGLFRTRLPGSSMQRA